MNRRYFLNRTMIFAVAGISVPLFGGRALGAIIDAVPSDDVLKGVVDAGTTAATSTMFKFAHHHILTLPKAVLEAAPADGFRTFTSRVVPNLGVAQAELDIKKEHHLHEAEISKEQLIAIREGRMVVVDILSGTQVVHQFLFNGPLTFDEQVALLVKTARDQNYLMSY